MLTVSELQKIAQARLKDAKALYAARRYDGAVYLGGYAVEIKLKARICKTLKWVGYPHTKTEFQGLSSFKVHDLDLLLKLSGRETFLKTNFLVEWSIANQWRPESRYTATGTVTRSEAEEMLDAVSKLVSNI